MQPDNPWAFPIGIDPFTSGIDYAARGMSLRDYFAGQIIMGMMANPHWDNHTPNTIAIHAGFQADAMLAEREKES